MLRIFTVICLLIAVSRVSAPAQCCIAGNPVSFMFTDQSNVNARALYVSSSFKYGYSGKYFSGSRQADMSFKSPASYSFVDIKAAYGVNDRFTLQAETGYFLSKIQVNPEPFPDDRGYGVGDAAVYLRYRPYKSIKQHVELTVSAGARLPVGVFDLEKNGVKLPLTLQPSSGSLVYISGISAVKGFENARWKFYSSAFAEFPQRIDSRNFYYRYGNIFNLSVAGAYPVYKSLVTSMQVQYELRGRATRENSQIVEASGHQAVSLMPQIEYYILEELGFQCFAELPVYRYFNGIQLASSLKTGFRMTYRFRI